ncbi:MAG: beta-galactosidase [Anaerolineae bacterium]|nr:beta-galactosidase [Anaerolineae bacterium]
MTLSRILSARRLRRAALRSVPLLARLGVLAFVLLALVPAPPRLSLGPPQTVETLHPKICVHTRLTDEVEEWKVQRTLALVREMGAPAIVEYFPWPYVDRGPGRYDWSHPDRILRHAENQGLRVIARLGLVPVWARPPADEKVTSLTYLPYDRFDEFAAFVGAFAARYRGRVQDIIIWNEPNLAFEWGSRPPDPEAYADLLRLSYAAAHAANPEVRVLGGALAPTLEPESSGFAMSDLVFLERLYAAGAAASFDALAVHTYGFTAPPDAPPDPGAINFRRVELLRAIMERHGDGDTPIVITESGWSDDPRWANGVRPGQRIAYTLAAFEQAAAWPWVEALCLWNFRIPADQANRRDAYFALVSSDFVRKPVYEAIQGYARGWETPYTP